MTRPSIPIVLAAAALLVAMAAVLLGLGRRDDSPSPAARRPTAPLAADTTVGTPVDTTVDAELADFRRGIRHVPSELEHAAPTRDSLVALFVRAVEGADTAALVRLAITRGEFAYLVYPSSPFTRPPYRHPPDLAWMQLEMPGVTGLRRVLERYAGRPIAAHGYRCDVEPVVEGDNRLWKHCDLRLSTPDGGQRWLRLFGVIVERHGRFKFASYENQL